MMRVMLNKFKDFLYEIPKAERKDFALSVGTSWKHLLNVAYGSKPASAKLSVNIERETNKRIVCEYLCPDVDWAVVRGVAIEV